MRKIPKKVLISFTVDRCAGIPVAGGVDAHSARAGLDIAMSSRRCTRYPAHRSRSAPSMELSIDGPCRPSRVLLERASRHVIRHRAGGCASNLRLESLSRSKRSVSSLAVGGLGVARARRSAMAYSMMAAPYAGHKPRYLMEMGRPEDIVRRCRRGIDMFDCVMPTRHARNAHLFTRTGVSTSDAAHRRHRPDRGGVRLLHLPQLQPQLPAAFGQVRRKFWAPT